MVNMSVYYAKRALIIAASVLLLACDEQAPDSNTETSDNGSVTAPATPEEKARQQALADEAESLRYLQEQGRMAQTAADTPTPTAMESVRAPQPRAISRAPTGRAPGDYSFTPPPPPPVSAAGQRLNLDPATAPRFEVTPRQWPASVDKPHITLWPQDKLAAFSLTIDDNHVQDHPFWFEVAEQYGWNWTWFVVVNQTGWGAHDHWGHWRKVMDKGHSAQSHTYSHLCDALFYTYREYRQSQATIEQNLQGAQSLSVAYPFGISTNKAGSPCEDLDTARTQNSRQEASRHFLAARNAYGALSPVAQLDYLSVPSISSARNFFNEDANWAYFDSIFDPNSRNYRTWYVVHYHGLYQDSDKADVRKMLAHIKQREADVWVGKFVDVAKYGQQYATASLRNVQSAANRLQFEVTDEMNDQWFDQPLTIKLRLPEGWNNGTVRVQQAGRTATGQVVQHNGQAYALVDAVPDRGAVVVSF